MYERPRGSGEAHLGHGCQQLSAESHVYDEQGDDTLIRSGERHAMMSGKPEQFGHNLGINYLQRIASQEDVERLLTEELVSDYIENNKKNLEDLVCADA